MKRFWIACLLLLLLVGLATLHVYRLGVFTDDLIAQLEQVEHCIRNSRWTEAGVLVEQVFQQWEGQALYLHTMLRHTEIDAIRSSLKEAQAYLDSREDAAECLAVTARLINQLELLLEAELPTVKNLL